LTELDPAVSPPAALPDRIYATLKHRILTCTMLPGSRIVEKDLCSEMRVSRTPLREALNRLALEGLVTIAPYRGYAITPLTLSGFRELCEVRRILEAEVGALAAKRATDEDITRLAGLAERKYRREDRERYERYLRANSAFPLALVKGARNSRLEALVMAALDQPQRPLHMGLGDGLEQSPLACRSPVNGTRCPTRWAAFGRAAPPSHSPSMHESRVSSPLNPELDRVDHLRSPSPSVIGSPRERCGGQRKRVEG
jgi:DNA-binding GntR family transcriptional regulator